MKKSNDFIEHINIASKKVENWPSWKKDVFGFTNDGSITVQQNNSTEVKSSIIESKNNGDKGNNNFNI